MEEQKIWEKLLQELSACFSLISYDMWLKPLVPLCIQEGILILKAPTEQIEKTVNSSYLGKINEVVSGLKSVLGINGVSVMSASDLPQSVLDTANPDPSILDKNATENAKAELSTYGDIPLNPKYSFDNFVVGKSNHEVYAAAKAIAEKLGKSLKDRKNMTRQELIDWQRSMQITNPLFIYGGVGLGKTHILHSIGNYLKESDSKMKILYTTGDKFYNDYVASMYSGAQRDLSMEFKNKYRNVDLLMIDDIQFIKNKTATQDELFHTFNHLYENNKQIVFASDRPPKDISPLEERLKSRFASGLIVNIQVPDIETRVAILQKKTEEENISVDDEVLYYIANKIDWSVREMEGLLNRTIFLSKIKEEFVITTETAKEAAKDFLTPSKDTVTVEKIIEKVCEYFGVHIDDLKGKKKNKEIVEPRQIAIYLINELMNMPLTAIGQEFGGRDHTTIIHARDKVSSQMKTDSKLATAVKDLRSMLLNKN